jgi:biotin transport system substrate-specific component
MEGILKREVVVSRGLSRFITVAVFIILTSLGGFVRIPLGFTPVPLTLQTFFVLLSGAFLGSGLGAVTQLGYIALGLCGLPIFTNAGSGIVYLLGPTGGYVLGFVLAALLVGRLLKAGRDNLSSVFLKFAAADIVLLSCGMLWLKLLFNYPSGRLFFIGFLPFVPGDLLKAWVAALIYSRLKERVCQVL